MRTRDTMRSPKHQITALVARSFPHWRLRMATLAGAANTSRAMAKLLGFQRCRPRYCSTYFEAIARKPPRDRKSTRLNSSHGYISYAVFCLKKKKNKRLSSIRTSASYTFLEDRLQHAYVIVNPLTSFSVLA